MTTHVLTDHALDILFRTARTANGWLKKPVGDDVLKKIYDLMKFGPTSANTCPLRVVFLRTDEAKARLKPALMEGNIEKTLSAPVVAILAQDMAFYEHMDFLFPHADARAWFIGNQSLIEETAFRNSSLQAAYFMMAARACGVDCGPMSGFDMAVVDKEFFANTTWRVNMLCNLGHIDPAATYPRSPRFAFDEVCKLL